MRASQVPIVLREYRCPVCGSGLLRNVSTRGVLSSRISCSGCEWTGEKNELSPGPMDKKDAKSIRLGPVIGGLGLAKFPVAFQHEARLIRDFYNMLLELLRKKQNKDDIRGLPALVISGSLEAAECYRHYRFCGFELRENWKTLKSSERHALSKSMVDYAAKCRAAIKKLGLSAVKDMAGDEMDMGDDEADDE